MEKKVDFEINKHKKNNLQRLVLWVEAQFVFWGRDVVCCLHATKLDIELFARRVLRYYSLARWILAVINSSELDWIHGISFVEKSCYQPVSSVLLIWFWLLFFLAGDLYQYAFAETFCYLVMEKNEKFPLKWVNSNWKIVLTRYEFRNIMVFIWRGGGREPMRYSIRCQNELVLFVGAGDWQQSTKHATS